MWKLKQDFDIILVQQTTLGCPASDSSPKRRSRAPTLHLAAGFRPCIPPHCMGTGKLSREKKKLILICVEPDEQFSQYSWRTGQSHRHQWSEEAGWAFSPCVAFQVNTSAMWRTVLPREHWCHRDWGTAQLHRAETAGAGNRLHCLKPRTSAIASACGGFS